MLLCELPDTEEINDALTALVISISRGERPKRTCAIRIGIGDAIREDCHDSGFLGAAVYWKLPQRARARFNSRQREMRRGRAQ